MVSHNSHTHFPSFNLFAPCSSCYAVKRQRGRFQRSAKLQSSWGSWSYVSWYLSHCDLCNTLMSSIYSPSTNTFLRKSAASNPRLRHIWNLTHPSCRAHAFHSPVSVTTNGKTLAAAASLCGGGRQFWMLSYRTTANDFWIHFCPPCGSLSVTTELLVTTAALDLRASCSAMQGRPAGGVFIN